VTSGAGDLFDPELFDRAALDVWSAARARGAGPKAGVEALLRHLPRERRERFLQLNKESRGVWALLLSARAGRALFVGSPLSGAVVPLAALGLDVVLLDVEPRRLLCAIELAGEQVSRPARGVAAHAHALPFRERSFDVVACDVAHVDDALLAELRRVCDGELFVAVDNRLGYKRSSGRAWELSVPGPLEYAVRAARPRSGERALRGWRSALARDGFAPPAAMALYPDRRDFAQVVSLDARAPALHVGPNERRNRVKLLGNALGLFPHLTPSYGLLTSRGPRAGPSRLQRALDFLAERTGEGACEVEHLIGSRGNVGIVMTRRPDAGAEQPRGRWLLHVPLYQGHRPGMELHFRMLERVRREFSAVPAPEPLYCGDAAGVWLCCERRLPGFGAHHHLRDLRDVEDLLAQLAPQLATLRVREARPFDDGQFEREVAPHFEATLATLDEPETRRALEALRERARSALRGLALPRVLTHSDLRAKHVQIGADGRINGWLDFGTCSLSELPGLDLLHHFVHDRKQLFGHADGRSWRTFLDPTGPTAAERAAFESYARALDLDLEALRSVALIYPAFVGSTAARNWSLARPGWFREHFQL
jgi:hypothetical protein